MIIRARDCFGSKSFCATGGKMFFEANGLDWNKFVKQGLDHEFILEKSNNDAQAIKAINYALDKIKRGL